MKTPPLARGGLPRPTSPKLGGAGSDASRLGDAETDTYYIKYRGLQKFRYSSAMKSGSLWKRCHARTKPHTMSTAYVAGATVEDTEHHSSTTPERGERHPTHSTLALPTHKPRSR